MSILIINIMELEKYCRNMAINIINDVNDETKLNKFTNKTKLILSGGGVKGIALVGALHGLNEYKCLDSIDTIAGTSVGALIGILMIIGYTPIDIYDFIMMFDISKMSEYKFDNIFNKFGLDDGHNIMIVIKNMFHNKNIPFDITFKQLYEMINKKIIITITCINDKKAIYCSVDNTPNLSVLLALRMSISVPLYFTPICHENRYYVDGGCIDNYPIQLFQDNLDQVIGIYLSDIQDSVDTINNIEDVLINIYSSILEGITCNSIKGFEKYSIKINLSGINVLDLQLDSNKKKQLFDIGYNSFLSAIIN